MPETSDSDFSWADFVKRNNDELVATYRNLANRILTLTYRNFDGIIPSPSNVSQNDNDLLLKAMKLFESVSSNLSACHFRMALHSAMEIARETNRYLEHEQPWKTIKTDIERTGTILWVGLTILNGLKIAMYPFLPFSSVKLHRMLGFSENIDDLGWDWDQSTKGLKPGQLLQDPTPLYQKLEEDIVDNELDKLKNND